MNSLLKQFGWSALLCCLLGIGLASTGCQMSGSGSANRANLLPVDPGSSDLLRPGDILIITFSGVSDPPPKHEDRVREDGTITLPSILQVQAAGKTRAQLQQEITRRYVPAYYKQLTVNVNSDARYYYVRGEVKQPRNYMYPGTMTVLKAIAAAGDFTDYAKKTKVQLMRANAKKAIIIDCIKAQTHPELDLPVYPEDAIYIPRRIF